MATQGQILPTMGAVVFGNQTQDLLPNVIQQQEQRRLLEAQQRQKEAQAMADSWRNNSLKASQGMLWNDEFAQVEQAHLNEGLNLQSRGIDPYTSMNPQAVKYREDQARIQAMQGARKGLEKQYVAINNIIQKDPNKFRSEDVKALQDFVSGKTFEDVYKQGLQLPQVRQRFNVQDAIKGSAVPFTTRVVENGVEREQQGVDGGATRRTILSRLNSTPDGQEYLAEITGGFTPAQLEQAPNTIEGARSLADGFYDSNPQFREQLALQGVTSKEDPRYGQFIDQFANNLIQSKARYESTLNNMVDQVSGGVRVVNNTKPNYAEARERRDRAKYQMQVTRFNERNLDKSSSGGGSYNPSSFETIAFGDDTESVMKKAPMYGFTKFNAKNVSFIGNGIIDLETGQRVMDSSTKSGDVVALSNVPVDSNTGALLSDREAKNNQNVQYKKMAVVLSPEKRASGTVQRQYMVPAELLPNNMAKPELYNQFMQSSFNIPQSKQSAGNNAPAKTQSTKTKITW